jgi:hypothetical protein
VRCRRYSLIEAGEPDDRWVGWSAEGRAVEDELMVLGASNALGSKASVSVATLAEAA